MPQATLARRLLVVAAIAASATHAAAQTRPTSPREFFGHEIGADYVLPNYTQFEQYWKRLDAQSDRMKLVDIGRTAEGRTQWMAIVTSPENHRNLDRYREIARRLALATGVDSAEARALASQGKAVVWIDGGLHANEVLGAQQLTETTWQLVSRDDPETMRILDDVVVLLVHANPDGMELVSNWYMREPTAEKRSTAYIPRLYQKYIGHDNNRDFYMSTQAETENLNRQLYHEWFPQIMYNHHQTGPTGTVMFAPPFRDPHNYVYDPLILTGIDLVGAAMHNRFVAEDKPGVTMRRGANYSTWWNGGLRTTTYFHNILGLLTETIGNPTPMEIPFIANRQIASADLPHPIAPQKWHFRSSVDYSVTANYAVLDVASRYRENFLYNIWRMGRNSIERGSRDAWTVYPTRVDSVRAAMLAERRVADADGMASGGIVRSGVPDSAASARYMALLRRPEWRDPRGYVIPASQPDFATATKFVNTLRENGITVHRATADFSVGGKRYPRGSFVVRTDQAFRPHVLDMFEPQDHPNDFRYEGGPPIPPYDNAGWTLAYQMGIEFDRVLEGFSGPFETVEEWNARPPAGSVVEPRGGARVWVLSPRQNDAFAAVNRLLRAGTEVYRLPAAWRAGGQRFAAGSFVVAAGAGVRDSLQRFATELGVGATGVAARPEGELLKLRPLRIGLWDRFGGSMPSGWVRYLFDQWQFPYEVVFAPQLDAGDLREKYDVLVFVDGAIPDNDRPAMAGMPDPSLVPAEYRGQLGNVTVSGTVPRLRQFMEAGGTVVTIGGSTALARHLDLPVYDALTERAADGTERHLSREKYYIPGSILRVAVDSTRPVAWGMDAQTDVMFDDSPVFRLGEDAAAKGVRRVAWFDSARSLRSGWAWGQERLQGHTAVAEARVGQGTLFLFGPEVTFRAQPHGTFKLLFNGLYHAVAEPARMK